jgi:hypothetical protein
MVNIILIDGQRFFHPKGEFAEGDANWLSVYDGIGATIAMYPKDKVLQVGLNSKAGETTGSDADSEDGHSKGQT